MIDYKLQERFELVNNIVSFSFYLSDNIVDYLSTEQKYGSDSNKRMILAYVEIQIH